MRIINIEIERHNCEDSYYTEHTPYYFSTRLSDGQIEDVLKILLPQYSENENCNCSDTWDINLDKLFEDLSQHKIYRIKSCKDFYIGLDDKYKYN